MKELFTTLKSLCCIIGILLSMQVNAQTDFPYYQSHQKAIGDVTQVVGVGFVSGSDPAGQACHNINRIDRRESINGSFGLHLYGPIDFSTGTDFHVRLYAESPSVIPSNKTIALGVRPSNGTNEDEVVEVLEITQFDQWVDYTFDFSSIDQSVEYNQVHLYFIKDDQTNEAEGMHFFVDEVKGPRVHQNLISNTASINEAGNIATITFNGHDALDKVYNPTFHLFDANAQEIGVKQTLVNGNKIELLLDRKIEFGEVLTYSFTNGIVMDIKGAVLKAFTGASVINHSNYTSKANTLLTSFNEEESLVDFHRGVFFGFEKAANPTNANETVGKIVRAANSWSNLEFKFKENTSLDVTNGKVFTLDIYLEDTGIENINKEVSFAIKPKDGNDKMSGIYREITCYNQWQTLIFDLSDWEDSEFDNIEYLKFFIGSRDEDNKAEGLTAYIKDVKGPSFVSNKIEFKAEVASSLDKVNLDVLTAYAIQTVDQTGFTVTSGGLDQTISSVTYTEKQIVLNLDNPLNVNENILVSFDATSGNVVDTEGYTLASFTDLMPTLPEMEHEEKVTIDNGVFYYHDETSNDLFVPFSTGNFTSEVVDNPYITADVSDAKVTKITRAQTSHGNANFYTVNDSYIRGDRNLVFKMMVYQEDDLPELSWNAIGLELLNKNDNYGIKVDPQITERGKWIELVFDYSQITENRDYKNDPDNPAPPVSESMYNRFSITFGVDGSPVDERIDGVVYYLTNLYGPHVQSPADALLYSLVVDGKLVDGFSSDNFNYTVDIPFGHTPSIKAEAFNADATVETVDVTESGATIKVTAVDGTEQNYTLSYNELDPSTVNTLASITVNGLPLSGFESSTEDYSLTYLRGSDNVPMVEAMVTDELSTITITPATEMPGTTTIVVEAQSGDQKTYTVNFDWTPASDVNLLSEIYLNGNSIGGFSSNKDTYEVMRNYGVTGLPGVSADALDPFATVGEPVTEIEWESNQRAIVSITVTPEDETAPKKTYQVIFKWEAPNQDASLSSLTVDSELVTDFDPSVTSYTLTYPYGTTDIPTIAGEVNDATASITSTTQAESWGATATIVVQAQDPDLAATTYSVTFNQEAPNQDASLSSLTVDSELITDFDPSVTSYTLTYPYGTTDIPTIAGEVNDATASITSTTQAESWGATATIVVQAQDPDLAATTYSVTFNQEAPSTDATLSTLTVNGEEVTGFDPTVHEYSIEYDYNTTEIPTLAGVANDDESLSVEIEQATEMPGVATVTVTAQDGTTVISYTVNYIWTAASTDATLSGISVNEEALVGFAVDKFDYEMVLPVGTTEAPIVSANVSDSNASIEITQVDGTEGDATIVVIAEDATTTSTYTISFSVEEVKSDNASLTAIMIDGEEISDFSSDVFEYVITLNNLPEITVITEDVNATVEVEQPDNFGDIVTITVTAEDEVTQLVYTLLINELIPTSIINLENEINAYSSASNTLTLKFARGFNNDLVRVIHLNGQIAFQQKVSGTSANITNLKQGIYVVQIAVGNEVFVRKVKI
ncbi:T9SS type A sorting domain-containing protein [Flammeovirga agarivorans]|uniref:T9SS type A sorting domain-containing protein n=1 Tax=Flammeovirga agarivorans TaxID=2726742 RepID=A0A7X8XXK9_9BACT|nr:T9SS type A sorting domain-containing protein [Flammeovirga agarivorans]NLR93316.1 T9SS type A sorting domain-containing protein [Flammeovirga agarivorans]